MQYPFSFVLKLASFKTDQRPYRSSAKNHVSAAVFAHVFDKFNELDESNVSFNSFDVLPFFPTLVVVYTFSRVNAREREAQNGRIFVYFCPFSNMYF